MYDDDDDDDELNLQQTRWHNMLVSDRRTFPGLCSTYSWWVTTLWVNHQL